MVQLFTAYVFIQSMLCGCAGDRWQSDFVRLRKDYNVKVQLIGRLDERIAESSGLAYAADSTFWTHSDSGHPNELYRTNLNGELLSTIRLQIPNVDWEDMAHDGKGNLYIGDFGNNRNVRRDLTIYRIQEETMAVKEVMHFGFSDQTEFPPPQRRRHHDVEAFMYRSDSLYIFTKSWALNPVTRLYKMPATAGTYHLEPKEELKVQSAITAADGAPDKNEFALLGYGRLYLFKPTNLSGAVSFEGKRYCLPIGQTGQAEALLYLSQNQLLVTNEKGKMFLITLSRK